MFRCACLSEASGEIHRGVNPKQFSLGAPASGKPGTTCHGRTSGNWQLVPACLAWLALCFCPTVIAAPLAPGKSHFEFRDWGGQSLRVFTSVPKKVTADTPVLFVMTGRRRNAGDYRDQWHKLAQEHGFIVLAPEFPERKYPGEISYDMGNVFRFPERFKVPALKSLKAVPQEQWAFSALEPLFDHARKTLGLKVRGYSLYGHSSGAGFVHRYLYYQPRARVERAVAANGAWYLLPSPGLEYPYGLRGANISKQQLKKAFSRELLIMIAQEDLGPRRQYFANTAQAKAQGPHVVSRGMNFLLLAATAAHGLKMPLNWKIESVPNVGHSNKAMAPHAVRHLFPRLDLAVRAAR